MLAIKDKGILLQIKTHCQRILDKISEHDKNIMNDLDTREIICFNLFQIGELAKKISDEFLETYNEVPWKQIKGMRDRIVHGYDTIDLDIVWNTAKENIAQLNSYCSQILRQSK